MTRERNLKDRNLYLDWCNRYHVNPNNAESLLVFVTLLRAFEGRES